MSESPRKLEQVGAQHVLGEAPRQGLTSAPPRMRKGTGNVHLPLGSGGDSKQPNSPCSTGRPAVFLDRDGVLVEEAGFLRRPEHVRILPGVFQALRSLASRFSLVVITNQSGIARGLFSEDDLLAIHQELAMRLAKEGVAIDAYYFCPHVPSGSPNGSVSVYRVDCECRKPKPGMLLQASSDFGISLGSSYMVGDRPSDIQAGLAAGAKSVILGESGIGCPESVIVAQSLLEAAGLILADLPESIGPPPDGTCSSAGPVPAMPGWEELQCKR